MRTILEGAQRLLSEAGLATATDEAITALTFEGSTVLGFIVAYDKPATLLTKHVIDVQRLVATNQLGLRRAQVKAWNAYAVLLAVEQASYSETIAFTSIEEDLAGTRKIVRAGVSDGAALRAALLPLLPLQNAPRLEAVDMISEIKVRTTELTSRVVEAFLSGASEAVVTQILEEAS